MTNQKNSGGYCVYIIETGNGSYYTGCTSDLERRFKQHSKGKGAKYTRINKPKRIVCSWHGLENRGAALKLEYYIKKQKRRIKEKFISQPGFLENSYQQYSGEIVSLECRRGQA